MCANSYPKIGGRREEAVNQGVRGGYTMWLHLFDDVFADDHCITTVKITYTWYYKGITCLT
jgi:hypothetical protein